MQQGKAMSEETPKYNAKPDGERKHKKKFKKPRKYANLRSQVKCYLYMLSKQFKGNYITMGGLYETPTGAKIPSELFGHLYFENQINKETGKARMVAYVPVPGNDKKEYQQFFLSPKKKPVEIKKEVKAETNTEKVEEPVRVKRKYTKKVKV